MKKIHIELIAVLVFVLGGTAIAYKLLSPVGDFWGTQEFWSVLLVLCWVVVASGYYHQGWKVSRSGSAANVSVVLPMAVFVVQCILFVKGIYYADYSLIAGALMVNSGVTFSLYQIFKARLK